MPIQKSLFFVFLLLFSLLSESCDSKKSNVTPFEQKQDASNYTLAVSEGICQILVPDYMIEMKDINPDAVIQRGYIQKDDGNPETIEDEIYAVVHVDYKNEIRKVKPDSSNVGIMDFYNLHYANLDFILSDLSVETDTPKVQALNGMNFVHNGFFGRLDEYLVYYQIGIFETDMGYYQVVTWCMQNHMQKHKEEMYKITSNFKEL